MKITVIDGQGGGVGKQLVESIKKEIPEALITAVGTNSAATQIMLKAGARYAATGENAVVVAAKTTDIITGPVGIVIADALLGEITPKMAQAIGQSGAWKVLAPMNMCKSFIAGTDRTNVTELIAECVEEIKKLIRNCEL